MSEKSKISLVLYQDQERPRYFELSSLTIKTLIYGLPIITLTCLLITLGMTLYFKEIRSVAVRKEPAIIQKLNQEKAVLAAREVELLAITRDLEEKLATTDIDTEGLSATLGLFKFVPGMEDLSANPSLAVEDVTLTRQNQGAALQFNLVNLTPDTTRQAGYIFALIISGGIISIYPEDAFSDDDPLITFNRGEYFATARFRPVEAEFKQMGQASKGIIKILLFSRTGDLLAKKTQSYQL